MSKIPEGKSRTKQPNVYRRRVLGNVLGVSSMLSVPGLLVGCGGGWDGGDINHPGDISDLQIIEASIADIQAGMDSGNFTAEAVVAKYIERIQQIDQAGPTLCSVMTMNPDAISIAKRLDAERLKSGRRGPLHGIPVILKDNIDTNDKMLTTAGSLALVGSRPTQDATVVSRLRRAGAIILGKANMSEWSNYRSSNSSNGWSARGGQAKNPYQLCADPFGSSTGSAVSVAANLVMVSLGTETNGSIITPAAANGVVAIKPTVGLTSRAGVIPISHNQDTVGPMARTVTDAAILLGALTGVDPRDQATRSSAGKFSTDYRQFLDVDGLRGARIGSFSSFIPIPEDIRQILQQQNATVVELTEDDLAGDSLDYTDEGLILSYDFKHGINAYLATLVRNEDARYANTPQMRTLDDLIAFNNANPDERLDLYDQRYFLEANQRGPITDPVYLAQVKENRQSSQSVINRLLDLYKLDALIGAAFPLLPSAMAGYPIVTLPFHSSSQQEQPGNVSFSGGAYSEPTLIKLAYALEQALQQKNLGRRPPRYRQC